MKKLNIVTCLGTKDLITFIFRSNIYFNQNINLYIISNNFSIKILKFVSLFIDIKSSNFQFINENKLLNEIGINDFNNYILNVNIDLYQKKNWYKQQILKYAISYVILDNYIIIDSDTFPTNEDVLKSINYNTRFFNKPSVYGHIHMPFEETYNRIFDSHFISTYDYVCEVFPVKIEDLHDMLEQMEKRFNARWYFVILSCTKNLIGFSEYQTLSKFQIENNKPLNYNEYRTDRHFGIKQLSIFTPKNTKTDFISYESYDYPKNFSLVIYYIIYKPFYTIIKLFNL